MIGNRLKEMRAKYGYSQTEIANYLNVSKQAVSKWENDQSIPENKKIYLLAKLYGISLDEMLGCEKTKKTIAQRWLLLIILLSALFFAAGYVNLKQSSASVMTISPSNPDNPSGINTRKSIQLGDEFDETKAVDITDILVHAKDLEYIKKLEAMILENGKVRFRLTLQLEEPYMFYAVGGGYGEFFDYCSEDYLTNQEIIFDLDCLDVFKQNQRVLLTIENDELYEQVTVTKKATVRLKNEDF